MMQQQNERSRKGMIRSAIKVWIPLDQQSEALEILKSISEQTQFKPGCVSSRLYLGVGEVRGIMIEELWMNEKDLMCHLRSDAYRQVLLVIEMSKDPPDIRFETIAHCSGVETIAKARTPCRRRSHEHVAK